MLVVNYVITGPAKKKLKVKKSYAVASNKHAFPLSENKNQLIFFSFMEQA
jgi:hypothetical protein